MGTIHTSVSAACQEYYSRYRRNVYVTPKSYLSFLEVYQAVYAKKLTQTRAMAAAINSGLQKMNDAKLDVNRMKVVFLMRNLGIGAGEWSFDVLSCLICLERITNM